jgi:histidinol-phosphate/aromatic aminotransferase/cobyric acid decarboxylase-like protein
VRARVRPSSPLSLSLLSQCKGREFLSWVWIDTGDAAAADAAVAAARARGVPIRSGRPGYGLAGHVRVAVRDEATVAQLLAAWRDALSSIGRA